MTADGVSVDEQLLLDRISSVSVLLEDIAQIYPKLQTIGARAATNAWTPVPSCQTFASTYLGAVNATVDVLYAAEQKVSGLVESLRKFATEMQVADDDALLALENLERQADAQLLAPREALPSAPSGSGRGRVPI